jgi:hypothetical protein
MKVRAPFAFTNRVGGTVYLTALTIIKCGGLGNRQRLGHFWKVVQDVSQMFHRLPKAYVTVGIPRQHVYVPFGTARRSHGRAA